MTSPQKSSTPDTYAILGFEAQKRPIDMQIAELGVRTSLGRLVTVIQ